MQWFIFPRKEMKKHPNGPKSPLRKVMIYTNTYVGRELNSVHLPHLPQIYVDRFECPSTVFISHVSHKLGWHSLIAGTEELGYSWQAQIILFENKIKMGFDNRSNRKL